MARSKQVKKAKTEDKRKLKDFIVILTTLANLYEAADDQGRAKSFNAAAKSLESFAQVTKGGLDNELKSSEDYKNVKGVGKSTLELMDEFIETGKCARLEELEEEDESEMEFEDILAKREEQRKKELYDMSEPNDKETAKAFCMIEHKYMEQRKKEAKQLINKMDLPMRVLVAHLLREEEYVPYYEERREAEEEREFCKSCDFMRTEHYNNDCKCDELINARYDLRYAEELGCEDLPEYEETNDDIMEVGDHTIDINNNWGSIKEEAEIEFNCGKLSVTVRLRRYESNCDWKDYADISGDYEEMCDLCDKNDEDFDDIIYDAFDKWDLRWVHE
jgi:hypothetical protein